MSYELSRRRKAEKAILAAFSTFAGTSITGVQTMTARNKTDLAPVSIRVHCNSQEPQQDESETIYAVEVSGTIIVTTSVDDDTISRIEELEGIAENFVEIETDEILVLLNAAGTAQGVSFLEWQPASAEDGVIDELRRYVSRYGFKAEVNHI